jgi:hypothetical protein
MYLLMAAICEADAMLIAITVASSESPHGELEDPDFFQIIGAILRHTIPDSSIGSGAG